MSKSRWEKKLKSKYKVLNRIKRMKYTYEGYYLESKIRKKWADIGCVCSCSQCSSKNSWSHKSDLKKMRDVERKCIDDYYYHDKEN